MGHVYNFSAGPAMLPKDVLLQAQEELCDWQGIGASVMEVSHRGKEFIHCAAEAEQDLRDLLSIPSSYKVLFCQGGARGQFMAVPQNLLAGCDHADYIINGVWSQSAADEADKICQVNQIDIRTKNDNGIVSLQPMANWCLSDKTAYIHYCPNETVDGLAIFEQPAFHNKVVVADLSSCILSQPIDITRYGVIYAGAQKNIGTSGLTVVIVRDDLLGKASAQLPSVLDYAVLAKSDSMFNTPPTFPWYLSGLVFKWLKKQGGLIKMEQRNRRKAQYLYDAIDNSDFYINRISNANRSLMNVTFHLADEALNPVFVEEAEQAGLLSLKGHRIAGGMRASIYNAMPIEGVETLIAFMQQFEKHHG